MKTTIKNISAKVTLLFFGLLSGVYAMAQDAASSQTQSNNTVSHTETTVPAPGAGMWYMNPIVWVVGGAVLLIIIILAVRGSSNTTVVRDGGPTRTTTTTIKES